MGLGPGGQPINANRLSGGGGMGSMGPGGQSPWRYSCSCACSAKCIMYHVAKQSLSTSSWL